ncbi:3-hydroxyacyl-CoA dehydrogenase family protein [Pelagibacterium lacus]|uniref:3-hydroxyacyl-CoA dehydrogenase family protein n=1 Tax=Pelagibacterium lacus TaxID=2282655 RepID=A0A369W2F5_9HYPH|nr:3-hydroxyacyl-CoA dehydrogenase NAD-binding domain-containing protein [Pelagibacterium lacus]RDE08219.1 3-hydroxyacyl-CoA dehydrogenase family protein [Pelagibacterium lacus]
MAAGPKSVAIIGAGLMGRGIAYVMASAGHQVSVFDASADALDGLIKHLAEIGELLGSSVPNGSVQVSRNLEGAIAGADIAIEAVSERIALKQEIFASLDALSSEECILCSNTSAIPLATIANDVRKKYRVVGTHFWNPPHLIPLVEVVQMDARNAPAVDVVINILKDAGRQPVKVERDIPGLIGNRLQHAMKREAIALVAAGVCSAETIDDVVKAGFGARLAVLGPLEQSDLVGLDLTAQIFEVLMPSLDRTPEPHPYLMDKIRQGKLGMKSGEGFRTWTPDQAQAVRDRLDHALLASAVNRST